MHAIPNPPDPAATLSTFACEDHEGVTVAEVACESVREHQAALMRDQLRILAGRNGGRLAIGLGRVSEVPASFLCDLMWLRERCERLGGHMVLFGAAPAVVERLRALGLYAHPGGASGRSLTIAASRTEAVAACLGLADAAMPIHSPSRRVLSWLRGERAA
jgi:hypothetical protein